MNGDSLVKLRTLKITSLDDEEDAEDECPVNINASAVIYEDDDDDDDEEPVTLGFVEKPKNQWSLLPHLFPSKAGGFPAWLDPINLPSGKSCFCGICGEPLEFLLQVYAPLFEMESTFHHTLFIFMCASMNCLLQDQHEQWKRHPDKASQRFSVANCLAPILFTPVNRQDMMGQTNVLRLELHYVVGVEPGKEIKFVVVSEEHVIALRNTRLFTGDQVIRLIVDR